MTGGLSWFFSAFSSICCGCITSFFFTKNCDVVHTTVFLKGCAVSCTKCAPKICLYRIWKIIVLHILNERISHSAVVLPTLKFNIPLFVAVRKTVQWLKCYENHGPPGKHRNNHFWSCTFMRISSAFCTSIWGQFLSCIWNGLFVPRFRQLNSREYERVCVRWVANFPAS
jgi:hypothetical protein